MENNQEHKVDKIFKQSLENQSITPPVDAWMGIHTYTIGQEEAKRKIGLRYVSLGVLFLLFSGLGLFYYIDNQNVVGKNKPKLLSQELLAENNQNGLENAVRVLNPASVEKKSSLVNTSISLNPIIQSHSSTLLSHQVDWSGDQPRDEISEFGTVEENPKSISLNLDSLDSRIFGLKVPEEIQKIINPTNPDSVDIYQIKIQSTELSSKKYTPIDLSKKMEDDLIAKIDEDYLQEKVMEEDSVTEETGGKKFSLKHPIISYGTGVIWNDWGVKTNDYNISTPSFNSGISRTSFFRLGVTWKVNRKSRLGFNVGMYNSGGFRIGWNGLITSSSINFPQIILNSDNSNLSYIAETPFGNVNIPIKTLTDNGFKVDVSNPAKSIQVSYSDLHSLTYTQGEISLENDLLSRKRKSGYSYQIYSISNLTFQRQISYNYWARDLISSTSSLGTTLQAKISVIENHLENAAEIVWGIKYGFGFRWQFAKKWNINIEGVMQNSLNSWVKNQPYSTNQKLYSIQTGIQLNL